MFKGYISNTIGHARWILHNQQSFLIPYLERIPNRIRGQVKEATNGPLLAVLRKERYKILGEFEVIHANRVQTYLVKIYKYPDLFQRIKQLFRHTKAFREFNMTYLAAMKGIAVEVPVAYGERKDLFAKESYLIIRKINHARTAKEFFRSDTSHKERRDVLEKFGNLSKNIHDAGVKQDDFSLDNFLVYDDEFLGKKIILIDFERVSIQAKSLDDKQRLWYLAKLNRTRWYVTNTDRLRFLLSYTGGDLNSCKKLAKQISAFTIHMQKKDAKKFRRQCIRENRKFGICKNTNCYGYYRKIYSLETLLSLLNTIEETDHDVFYRNHFQILRFRAQQNGYQSQSKAYREKTHFRDKIIEQTAKKFDYNTIARSWRHANALFALGINVLVPIGIFKRRLPKLPKEGFLISQMPNNCIPLNQYVESRTDKNPIVFALLRLAEQVSPFGTFNEDLNTEDILVQLKENRQIKCYLGNYTSFRINNLSIQTNRATNAHVIKQLLQINDA